MMKSGQTLVMGWERSRSVSRRGREVWEKGCIVMCEVEVRGRVRWKEGWDGLLVLGFAGGVESEVYGVERVDAATSAGRTGMYGPIAEVRRARIGVLQRRRWPSWGARTSLGYILPPHKGET